MVSVWLSEQRDRLVGELVASGLCERCAAIFIDGAVAFTSARAEGREPDDEGSDYCDACLERLRPTGFCCQIVASLHEMARQAWLRGAAWAEAESFGMIRAVIEGWRPGKDN